MHYEWDRAKAAANLAKHGIHFSDAVSVFADGGAISIHDPHPEETRFITIGMDAFSRVLVVVYTFRIEHVRLISARKATRAERAVYARGDR
jgi:uncharacterized DUF497 family protein